MLARAPHESKPALAFTDLGGEDVDAEVRVAIEHARPWRRTARAGIYDPHYVTDSRSENRTAF